MSESTRKGFWGRLQERLRPTPIATAPALRSFLEERALFLAQKCAIDYVRGKTGLASYALFTEKPFLDALEVCRWETFASALGDLLLLVEKQLRPHLAAGQEARLCEALAALYRSTLGAAPALAHRPQGWDEVIADFDARLEAARRAAPRQTRHIADHTGKRLFDTLPIHLSMRKLDEEVVYGAVRFRMIALSRELEQRIASAELARQLTA